jgi:coenzyme F420-reducing hydrogenase gamma subunit
MGRRLNWEKAKRRDRQRVTKLRASAKKAKAKQRRGDDFRQQAIQAFVAKHSIECFGCGTQEARWAKNGISKRGPWVICVPCVARHRREKGLPGTPVNAGSG